MFHNLGSSKQVARLCNIRLVTGGAHGNKPDVIVRRQSNLCTHFSFYSAKITKKFGGGRVLWGNWTGLVSVWDPPSRRRVPQKGVSSYQQAPLIGKQGSCQRASPA